MLLAVPTLLLSLGVAQEPAVANVHLDQRRQAMYGFGGSITFNGDALIDFPKRDAVYRALFSDLKLDILRLRNYHDYGPQQAAYERKTKDFARGALKWGTRAKRAGKQPVLPMFASWSPPGRLKSNNLVSGRSDGTDKGKQNVTLRRNADGSYQYGEFADWWLASLQNFRKQTGVYPDYIALQNELDIAVTYEGCEFLPSEGTGKDGAHFAGYDRALEAVSNRLTTALKGQTPKIVGPETFTIRRMPNGKTHVQSYADPTTESGRAVLGRLWGVSYHIYGSEAETGKPQEFQRLLQEVRDTYKDAKPMFQTEFLEGTTLTSLGAMISDSFTHGNAGAYFVWILARGANLAGYAAVFYNPADGSIERRERFYALKHFSEYVGEGWNRVAADCADPAVKLSAYINPDGKRAVTVLVNPTDQDRRIRIAKPFTNAMTSVHRSSEGDGGERWRDLGVLPSDGVATLPKRSMLTVAYDQI